MEDRHTPESLRIKQGLRISLYCQPEYYLNLFRDFPNDVKVINNKPKVESLVIS
jgi:hypothetical protein